MRIMLPIAAALLAVNCSNSPTAPTPVTAEPAPPAPTALTTLRWDVTAPGCPAKAPPSPIPDPMQGRLEPGPHGTIVAFWPTYRLGILQATLVEQNSQLLLCDWEIADI